MYIFLIAQVVVSENKPPAYGFHFKGTFLSLDAADQKAIAPWKTDIKARLGTPVMADPNLQSTSLGYKTCKCYGDSDILFG